APRGRHLAREQHDGVAVRTHLRIELHPVAREWLEPVAPTLEETIDAAERRAEPARPGHHDLDVRRRDRGERLTQRREPGLVAQGRDQVAVGEQLEEGRNPLLLAEHRPSMAQASISFPRAMAIADHELTDEQKAITEMVRQFADNEIIPVAEEFD